MAKILDTGTLTLGTAQNPAPKYVGFKVGPSSSLQNFQPFGNTAAVAGCFYLTSDTHQLYVGNDNGTLSPVNEGIITVGSENELPTASDGSMAPYTGHFYYISSLGVLAVYNGNKWVQINPDTYIEKTWFQQSSSDGTSTITHVAKNNGAGAAKVSLLDITGAGGITVSSSGATNETNAALNDGSQTAAASVTITGTEYSVNSSSTTGGVDINLNKSSGGAASTVDSSVTLKGGSHVSVSKAADSNEITIASKNTINTGMNSGYGTGNKGFNISVSQGYDDSSAVQGAVSATIEPKVKLGTNTTLYEYVNGTVELPVYTKSEVDANIDDLLQGLNAMTYRGTVGSDSNVATGFNSATNRPINLSGQDITDIKIGDTFLVSSKLLSSNGPSKIPVGESGYRNLEVSQNSLIIAKGTEDPDTGYITSGLCYDIVVADSGTDTHYGLLAKTYADGAGINLRETNAGGGEVGALKIIEGTGIDVSGTIESFTPDGGTAILGAQSNITISHASITTNTSTGTGAIAAPTTAIHSQTLSVPIVTGITTDNGHVTGVTTTTYTLRDSQSYLTNYQYDTVGTPYTKGDKTVAVVSDSVIENYGNNQANSLSRSHTYSSESLTITADNTNGANASATTYYPGLKIDLMWGSF